MWSRVTAHTRVNKSAPCGSGRNQQPGNAVLQPTKVDWDLFVSAYKCNISIYSHTQACLLFSLHVDTCTYVCVCTFVYVCTRVNRRRYSQAKTLLHT